MHDFRENALEGIFVFVQKYCCSQANIFDSLVLGLLRVNAGETGHWSSARAWPSWCWIPFRGRLRFELWPGGKMVSPSPQDPQMT